MSSPRWKRTESILLLPIIILLFASGCATLHPHQAEHLVACFRAGKPASIYNATSLEMKDALLLRSRFVEILIKDWGPIAGYKAALTNPKAQEKFGVKEPVDGILLSGMLHESGAEISIRSGTRLMCEADLAVRVAKPGLEHVDDAMDCLDYLDAVYPFIEVPGHLLHRDIKPTGAILTAINAGAHFGVLGVPIALENTPATAQRLENFTASLRTPSGDSLTRGTGGLLLGHPLKAVLWLAQSLHKQGIQVKPGDILSLGSLTRMVHPMPGMELSAVYEGLDPAGPVSVRISFVE